MHFPRDVVPDPNAATVRLNEGGVPVQQGSDWLGDALGQITGQIQRRLHEVENRHHEAMREMQAKLERMSREAERARPNLPPDLAAAFGRIEEGMTELASRITHGGANGGPADKFVFAPKTDDTISFVLEPPAASGTPAPRLRGPAPEGGWDDEAAEALMQLYESGDTGLSVEAMALTAPHLDGAAPSTLPPATHRRPAMMAAAGLGPDRKWLEERFGELTGKFAQSLAEVRPDAALDRMLARVDSLEQRFDTAIASVAAGLDKTASAASIKQIETQLSELGRQVGAVHQQLGRLNGIEQNLMDLNAFAAASQDAGAETALPAANPPASVDVAALADAVAHKAAERLQAAAPNPAAGADAVAKAMLDRFVADRRRTDEQTNGMLDTMQEALVRLLDRVEAIDAATASLRQPAPAAFAPAPAPMPAPEAPVVPAAEEPPAERRRTAPGRPARTMSEPTARQKAREAELMAAHEAEIAAKTLGEPKVEVISADDLAAPAPATAASAASAAAPASSNNPRGRVRATVNANVPEPLPEEQAAADSKKRKAPRAKSAASPSVSRRGMIIATIVLGLVGVSYIASLLLSDRYGSLIPGQSQPPAKTDLRGKQPLTPEPVPAQRPTPAPVAPPSAPAASEPQRSGSIERTPQALPARPAVREEEPAVTPGSARPPASVPETVTDDLSAIEESEADPSSAPKSMARLNNQATRTAAATPSPAPMQASTPFAGLALDRSQPALRPNELGAVLANNVAESSRPLAALRTQPPAAPAPQAQAQQVQQAAPPVVVKNAASIVTGATNRATVTSFGAQPQAPQAPANTGLTENVRESAELPPAGVGPLSLRMSAAQGDPSAAFEVGSRLAEGRGVRQDFNAAFAWYQRAAAKGFALAQYRLGTLFERGLGTPADLERARVWYKRAAEQGNVKAMHNLAVLAAGREGVAPDHAEAAKWFGLAAERGLPDSQYNLGVLHENGLGVAKDTRTAYKWFSLAARGGDKDASRRRDALLATLDVATLGAVDSEIEQWRARSTDRIANEPRVAGDLWRNRRPAEPPQQQARPDQQQPDPAQMQQQMPQQPAAPAAVRRAAPQILR